MVPFGTRLLEMSHLLANAYYSRAITLWIKMCK